MPLSIVIIESVSIHTQGRRGNAADVATPLFGQYLPRRYYHRRQGHCGYIIKLFYSEIAEM